MRHYERSSEGEISFCIPQGGFKSNRDSVILSAIGTSRFGAQKRTSFVFCSIVCHGGIRLSSENVYLFLFQNLKKGKVERIQKLKVFH